MASVKSKSKPKSKAIPRAEGKTSFRDDFPAGVPFEDLTHEQKNKIIAYLRVRISRSYNFALSAHKDTMRYSQELSDARRLAAFYREISESKDKEIERLHKMMQELIIATRRYYGDMDDLNAPSEEE